MMHFDLISLKGSCYKFLTRLFFLLLVTFITCFLVGLNTLQGQTIFIETFDTEGEGVNGVCANDMASSCDEFNLPPSNGQWTLTGNFSIFSQGNDWFKTVDGLLEARDAASELCFETVDIPISGFGSVFFSLEAYESGILGINDYIDVKYSVDGGPDILIEDWEDDGGTHTLEGDFNASIVRARGIVGNTLKIKVCFRNDETLTILQKRQQIDNLVVQGVSANPDLQANCPLRVALVLDESGSIADTPGAEQQVEDGARAYVNSVLDAQIPGSELAVIEFNSTARQIKLDNDGGYAVIDQAFSNTFEDYLNDQVGDLNGEPYGPGIDQGLQRATNWEAALLAIQALPARPDLVIFFTDGNPTAYLDNNGLAIVFSNPTENDISFALVEAIPVANEIKADGTHMYVIGVGSGVDEGNMRDISGPDKDLGPGGPPSIFEADYTLVPLEELQQCLSAIPIETCGTEINISKTISNQNPCVGDTVSFFVTVGNKQDGIILRGLQVADGLLPGFEYLGGTPPDTTDDSQGLNLLGWLIGDLADGADTTLEVIARVLDQPDELYTNLAFAGADNALDAETSVEGGVDIFVKRPPQIICPDPLEVACGADVADLETELLNWVIGAQVINETSFSTRPSTVAEMITTLQAEGSVEVTFFTSSECGTDSCVTTITQGACCEFQVECPVADGGTFDCSSEVPAPATTVAEFEALGGKIEEACNGAISIAYVDSVAGEACSTDPIVLTRTYTLSNDNGTPGDATDDSSVSCTITYTIDEPQQVQITFCPPDTTLEWAIGLDTSPAALGTATGESFCGDAATISFNDRVDIGNCDGYFVIMRTWTAVDSCGKKASCEQIITVMDTQAPSITCPADASLEWVVGLDLSPASLGEATATDECDPNPAIRYEDNRIAGQCEGDFTIERTWYAKDECGNESSCVQTIRVEDNTAPEITCPADLTIELDSDFDLGPVNLGTATATDACDPSPVIDYEDNIIAGDCPGNFVIERTWSATDECGNRIRCVQTITVRDTRAPVVICAPDVTLEWAADLDTSPSAVGAPIINDAGDPSPEILIEEEVIAGDCAGNFTIFRTYTATDHCGNTATCTQEIEVRDTTAPVFDQNLPAEISLTCGILMDPPVVTASDACDPDVEVTFASSSNDGDGTECNPLITTWTWTATDDCGNSTTVVQTITTSDCAEECRINGITAGTPVCNDDGTYNIDLCIDYDGNPSDLGVIQVEINGDSDFIDFPLTCESPFCITLENLRGDGQVVQIFARIGLEGCTFLDRGMFVAPVCDPVGDCKIVDMQVASTDCDENNSDRFSACFEVDFIDLPAHSYQRKLVIGGQVFPDYTFEIIDGDSSAGTALLCVDNIHRRDGAQDVFFQLEYECNITKRGLLRANCDVSEEPPVTGERCHISSVYLAKNKAVECNDDGTYNLCLMVSGSNFPAAITDPTYFMSNAKVVVNHHRYDIAYIQWRGSDLYIAIHDIRNRGTRGVEVYVEIDRCNRTVRNLFDEPHCYGYREISDQPLVYPNPTSGILNVLPRNISRGTIRLINALGQVRYEAKIKGDGLQSLDLKGLEGGLFILEITDGKQRHLQHVIIE